MNLFELFDPADFALHTAQGYVRVSWHPDLDLRVLCYTETAVYEQRWNAVTRHCRGLIIDGNNEIIAHCMPKFHNAEEHINGKAYASPLPNEPFRIFDKADGSMGTVFWYGGKWRVATKGGFQSEQAKWAQKWLDDQATDDLPETNTYVTEIIYPQNRIVVDNGDQQTLTLLAVYGADGREKDLQQYGPAWERLGGTVIREYPATSLSRILFHAGRNKTLAGEPVAGDEAEGYVLRYASGLRVKIKMADYIRLHGIITGLSERNVWELLRNGETLASLLEVLPDEYHDWLLKTAHQLRTDFRDVAVDLVRNVLRTGLHADPREVVEACDADSDVVAVYRVLADLIWPRIKPAANGPWKDIQ